MGNDTEENGEETPRGARRLLEEQDKILRSYFAQKYDREPNREEQTGHTMRQRGREHIGQDVYA